MDEYRAIPRCTEHEAVFQEACEACVEEHRLKQKWIDRLSQSLADLSRNLQSQGVPAPEMALLTVRLETLVNMLLGEGKARTDFEAMTGVSLKNMLTDLTSQVARQKLMTGNLVPFPGRRK